MNCNFLAVFVTFCHSERSDSDLIFLIPARRKNKKCNVELSSPKETEREHVDVICSNTWTTDHDNNRQKQNQDNKSPVKCHYVCKSCAMSKSKNKGEKAKEYIEETNINDEKMEDEEMEEDTDQDEDEDYENEKEIDQTGNEVIPNKSKTILLKICKQIINNVSKL